MTKNKEIKMTKNTETEKKEVKRIALTDDSGRWFDSNKSQKFDEDTFWNGRNRISAATGEQCEHEALYRTASGRWILNAWSQWGGIDSYEEIDDDAAASWLIKNNQESEIVSKQIADLEI